MPQRRVLMADDALCSRILYRRFLQKWGYSCLEAQSGVEALEQAEAYAPDLALLDISMPGMDGIECCRRLRESPKTRDIPVVFMTGAQYPQSLLDLAAKGLGTEPVFHKYEDEDILHQRVRRALRSSHKPGGLQIDLAGRRIWIAGQELPRLPAKRFDLLYALLRNGGPITRQELLQRVWAESDNLNTLDVTMSRLRQDLADCAGIRIEMGPEGYRAVIGGD